MPTAVHSAALSGIHAFLVSVEVDLLRGLPSFTIGGLGDCAVHEARDRIRSAIKHSGFRFPQQKKIINLAPARVRKHGAAFDLPMALGLLAADGQIPNTFSDILFLGELSLDGAVRAVPGVLPFAHCAQTSGFRGVCVPFHNAQEAALCRSIDIFHVRTLREAISILHGKQKPYCSKTFPPTDFDDAIFSNIQGHETIKRALAIAAAGFHSVFLTGPPGTGKTMLARGVRELLPSMSLSEIVAVTTIYSVAGLLHEHEPVIARRPFRSVHASATRACVLGGGSGNPRPGELSLAHRGVFFFDEMGEGERETLEALRQPLETREIVLGRSPSVQFPADVLFVGAMNPCPCGFRGDTARACKCGSADIARYQRKISPPLLDRIDLSLHVPRISASTLLTHRREECSRYRECVARAWEIQQRRFQKHNSRMDIPEIQTFCTISQTGKRLLEQAINRFSLSPRAYHRILKVARTIADISDNEQIADTHIAEAISYRTQSTNLLI